MKVLAPLVSFLNVDLQEDDVLKLLLFSCEHLNVLDGILYA